MVIEDVGDADLQVEDGWPALIANVQQVPEALAGNQAASLALPLQKRVGSHLTSLLCPSKWVPKLPVLVRAAVALAGQHYRAAIRRSQDQWSKMHANYQ